MTTWNRIHHVGLHDTGEHADYFSASYMKILLTDEARIAKYISRILKLLEHFIFTFYISYTCVECGKDVMSYFASSSSYSNTFLVSAFTISQKLYHPCFFRTKKLIVWLIDWSLEGRGHVASHSWDTIMAAGKLHKEVWVLLQIWVSSRVREQQFCVSRVTKQMFTFSRFMKIEVVQNAKNAPP